MAKSVSTNFSFRINNKNVPKIVGDSKVASGLTSENFYCVTYTVDKIGIHLGHISDFLAIQAQNPILIDFKRVDMSGPSQIYCSKLFINHGEMGDVWLKLADEIKPVVVTVWYSTDKNYKSKKFYVDTYHLDSFLRSKKKLGLRDLSGKDVSLPIEINKGLKYIGIDKLVNNNIDHIKVFTHTKRETKLLVNSD